MKSRTKPALRLVAVAPAQLSLNIEGVLRDMRHALAVLAAKTSDSTRSERKAA